jgi:ethanolamine transporter
MMLLGAFPAVHLIVTFGAKPLSALGKLVGVNKSAAGGLIATLANNIAMFEIFKNMDRRGKILNAAFAVSAAFALGDHLGFTAGVAPDMIAPMIAGKLVAGITAVALAFLLFAKTNPPATSDDDVVAEAEAGE